MKLSRTSISGASVWIFLLAALAAPQAADAVISFTQLDDDIFVVSHRVKLVGSRGQATKLVYEKAASLCVAAGFSYFKVLEQESEAAQGDDTANASVRVQFFQGDDEGRIDCQRNASPEYIQQAGAKLAKQGYRPPEPAMADGQGSIKKGSEEAWSCTVEQISAMVRAGFSDPQIKAACPGEGR